LELRHVECDWLEAEMLERRERAWVLDGTRMRSSTTQFAA
jgi:hypothetical protein